MQAEYLIRQLSGFDARARIERGEKPVRFSSFSAQCEAGNVKILLANWNTALFDNSEAFPDATQDDTADACSGAFGMLQTGTTTLLPSECEDDSLVRVRPFAERHEEESTLGGNNRQYVKEHEQTALWNLIH